jgi:heme exporter protein D
MLSASHALYIAGSYAAAALVVAGLLAWVLLDGRRLRRELERLEASGARRRAVRAATPPSEPEPNQRS